MEELGTSIVYAPTLIVRIVCAPCVCSDWSSPASHSSPKAQTAVPAAVAYRLDLSRAGRFVVMESTPSFWNLFATAASSTVQT